MKKHPLTPLAQNGSTDKGGGFTLVELLVVLATLAMLAALVLPTMAASREKSPRAQCKSNLQQLWLATQLYADENQGNLPRHPASGLFLWDLPAASADSLTESGARRQIMYCPAASSTQALDALWNFNLSRRVVGYFCLFQRIGFPGSLIAPKQFVTNITQPMPNSTLAESELITDVVISDPSNSNFDLGLPSAISPRGFYGSSHMQGRFPAGGYILFLDGHVAWRSFDKMTMWYTDPLGRAHWWF